MPALPTSYQWNQQEEEEEVTQGEGTPYGAGAADLQVAPRSRKASWTTPSGRCSDVEDRPAFGTPAFSRGGAETASTATVSPTPIGWASRDGKARQDDKEEKPDPNLVQWEEGDPTHPLKWSKFKKWLIIVIVSSCSFCVTCNSSIVSSTFEATGKEFHISKEVSLLGLSLFVAGLGCAPLVLGPASEVFGRKPIYTTSLTLFLLLQFPVAFANNPAVYFIFRFLCGFTGSAFLSVAGGTISDVFAPNDIFTPMGFYTASPFLGPTAGPLIGSFIVYNTSWRWVWYTTIIWTAVELALCVLFVPETYAPKILMTRARQLRKETGNEALYTVQEKKLSESSFTKIMTTTLSRVPVLLATEPMLLILCIWSALLLGILYLLFEAFPIVFTEGHGFKIWQTGLAFLGQAVGNILALLTMPLWARRYKRAAEAHGGKAPPEARLPMTMVGAFCTVIGLFIFAFTSYPHVHWIAPILGTLPFGAGVLLIYTGVFTYTTSAWLPVAASALSANSLVRSAWAAAFPLFSSQMYHAMGPVGASALLAGLNVLMIPIPFILYKKGPQIRARSKFAASQ
ncbi:unnamed protein product [Parajaminaea phylloscopi]